VGNDEDTRFWEDVWIGNKSLAKQYPYLYNIMQRKQVSIANVLNENPLNIDFRRTLTGDRWNMWLHLVQRLISVQLTNEKDTFIWGLTTSRTFNAKSMYLDLLDDDTKYHKKYIWKIKVPLKIKVFMWFLHRKVILTKDNLVKRNWNGNESCYFCDNKESIQHVSSCQNNLVHYSYDLWSRTA
jgi:hypothetical protein